MPEGKSKHPGMVKEAREKVTEMRRAVSKMIPLAKTIATSAANLKTLADACDKSFKDQLTYCDKLVEKYVTKCNEIADIEIDLEGAKGDKKAEAELLKKHKKADGEAEDIRTQYGEAVKVFITISDSIDEAGAAAASAIEKFSALRSGA